MGRSQKARGKTRSGIDRTERSNLLRIAAAYLEHQDFRMTTDLQTKYFQRIAKILKRGRRRVNVSHFANLHPGARSDFADNVHTEVYKLRKRIKKVAEELGLPEITLTHQAGQKGTYEIGVALLGPPMASHSTLFRISSPFWSRAVVVGGPPVMIFMIIIISLVVLAVWVRSRTVWATLGIMPMILIASCLILGAIPLSVLLNRKFRALWPTSLYLKLEDGSLRIERIWLDCPYCAALRKKVILTPIQDRPGRGWLLQCRNDPEHTARFHPMTYRVDLLPG